MADFTEINYSARAGDGIWILQSGVDETPLRGRGADGEQLVHLLPDRCVELSGLPPRLSPWARASCVRRDEGQAAARSAPSRLSHEEIWFQLTKMRLTRPSLSIAGDCNGCAISTHCGRARVNASPARLLGGLLSIRLVGRELHARRLTVESKVAIETTM